MAREWTYALQDVDADTSVIDQKGDLVVGTAADLFTRLPVGEDGDALLANSDAATGVEWGGPTPHGDVLAKIGGGGRRVAKITSGTETLLDLKGDPLYIYADPDLSGIPVTTGIVPEDGGFVAAPDFDIEVDDGLNSYTDYVRLSPAGVLFFDSYGAVPSLVSGNPAVDSTAAIQAALDATNTSPGVCAQGGRGVYGYTNLEVQDYTLLQGLGINVTTLRRIGGTGVGITDQGSGTAINLRDICIDNNSIGTDAVVLGLNTTFLNTSAGLYGVKIQRPGADSWCLKTDVDVFAFGKLVLTGDSTTAGSKGWYARGGGYVGGPLKLVQMKDIFIDWDTVVSEIQMSLEVNSAFIGTDVCVIDGTQNTINSHSFALLSKPAAAVGLNGSGALVRFPSGSGKNTLNLAVRNTGSIATTFVGINDEERGTTVTVAALNNTDPYDYHQIAGRLGRFRSTLFQSSTGTAWTDQPSAVTELLGVSGRARKWVDTSRFLDVRLHVTYGTVAGFAGSTIRLQFSIDAGSTFKYFDEATGGTGPSTGGTTTVTPYKSTWIGIPSEARIGDLLIRAVGANGDGIVDPLIVSVEAEFRR